MSVGVDERTNSLVVLASETLFREVKALVDQLDGANATNGAEVVRVIPNHVCVVVNMVDRLIAVRGERIVEVLPVAARGKLV